MTHWLHPAWRLVVAEVFFQCHRPSQKLKCFLRLSFSECQLARRHGACDAKYGRRRIIAHLPILGNFLSHFIEQLELSLCVLCFAQRRQREATSEVPLQARDVIRSVNKKEISTLQGLREAIRALPPGSPVTLQVQREGRLMYVSFTLD